MPVRLSFARVAVAVAFTVPAACLTNETFQPVDQRIGLEGTDAAADVTLSRSEPLFLEYGLTLRSDGTRRPVAVITLNGVEVTRVPADRRYVPIGGKALAPAAAARAGANALRVRVDGDAEATFELNGRLQNYYGIAPDFPRVFVVSDAALRHFLQTQSMRRTAVLVAACFGFGVVLAHLSGRPGRSRRRQRILIGSPLWLPWLALGYSLATPLHIWLSIEALVVAAVSGWAVAAAGLWIADRRVRIARAAAVAAVNVLLLEAALRGFNAVRPSFVFYSSGYERYRGQPGARFYDTTLNSGGFNDVEHSRARPAGIARRVVAIGDSFALGVVPYRDNYLTLLEAALSADGGGAAEVINIGIPATEPADYLAMLVKEGLPYAPDLVIANVFVGNDFEVPGRRWHEHSFLATLVRALWRLRGGTPPDPAASDASVVEYRDDEPSLPRERFMAIEVDRSWLYVRTDAAMPRAVARVGDDLRAMRDVAARAGAGFVVVLIPDEVQVDERLRADVVRASGHLAADLDFDRPNRLLGTRLSADGIRVVDLCAAFRNAGRTTRLYKPMDTHWNVAGNHLAARELAAALRVPAVADAPPR